MEIWRSNAVKAFLPLHDRQNNIAVCQPFNIAIFYFLFIKFSVFSVTILFSYIVPDPSLLILLHTRWLFFNSIGTEITFFIRTGDIEFTKNTN
jgi:hypothetical protein